MNENVSADFFAVAGYDPAYDMEIGILDPADYCGHVDFDYLGESSDMIKTVVPVPKVKESAPQGYSFFNYE